MSTELAGKIAQGARDRRKRQTVSAEFDALTNDDARALRRCLARELLDESGLADACLATEQHCRGLAVDGIGERRA